MLDRIALLVVAIALLCAALPAAGDPSSGCEPLPAETRFIDTAGNEVDLDGVDFIALREREPGTVVVYRRSASDADALVRDLAAQGALPPEQLDREILLLAASANCRMRAGTCVGACPGVQRCRRIKKAGKDICSCVR